MRIILRTLKVSLITLALSHCGGGGGGGGGSSSNSTTGVRVLHSAIEASPLDLALDGVLSTQGIPYGSQDGYTTLGKGQHLIQLSETKGAAGSLYSQSITNEGGQKFTLVFYGDRGSLGLRNNLISEFPPTITEGSGAIRVIDGAVGASAVRFSINSADVNANFGSASPYIELSPGTYTYTVARLADGAVFAQGSVVIEAGSAYSVFIAGEYGYFITNTVLPE